VDEFIDFERKGSTLILQFDPAEAATFTVGPGAGIIAALFGVVAPRLVPGVPDR
jgi:hypothetical protein